MRLRAESRRWALFGATGQTGSRVLAPLLERGDSVQALVRSVAKLPAAERLVAIEGDARDRSAVTKALRDVDGAICCLGMSDITIPATDFSDSLRTIVETMTLLGVRRLLAIASAGVLPDGAGGLRFDRGVPEFLARIAAEHRRNLETLQRSTLDWTLFCPMNLVGTEIGEVRIAFDELPPGGETTAYRHLADQMVEFLDRPDSIRRRVGIITVPEPS